jgi:predicted nucleic acid-binding protein
VSAVVADTSVWVELFAGRPAPGLIEGLRQGSVVLPPIVVAELISGARQARDRAAIQGLVNELPLHETPLEHWPSCRDLRRRLAERGVSVSTPDAHVAQCALERDAILLSRHRVFARIAKVSALSLQPG